MRHLSADERAAARLMPDEMLSMLAGLPVDAARSEIRSFMADLEGRGYRLAGVGDPLGEDEDDE